MQDAFAYCAELVRTADRDRFLASLFAPAEYRGALHALYAFNVEVARVREVAHAPLPGEIRLQWWREVIGGERGEEAKANPVAAALLAAILTGSVDRDQAGADAAVFHEHDVVGTHRRARCHDVDGDVRFAKPLAQSLGQHPRRRAGAEDEKIQGRGAGECERQRVFGHVGRRRHRPRPDPVGQAQKRTAMRHAGETEPAAAMGIDQRLARQMRRLH